MQASSEYLSDILKSNYNGTDTKIYSKRQQDRERQHNLTFPVIIRVYYIEQTAHGRKPTNFLLHRPLYFMDFHGFRFVDFISMITFYGFGFVDSISFGTLMRSVKTAHIDSFQGEQSHFLIHTATIAREITVCPHHSVAGNDDRNRVTSDSASDRSG